MKHRVEITIASPPERVFAVYTDPKPLPRWRPSITEVAGVSGPMDRVGTTFTSVYREDFARFKALVEEQAG